MSICNVSKGMKKYVTEQVNGYIVSRYPEAQFITYFSTDMFISCSEFLEIT